MKSLTTLLIRLIAVIFIALLVISFLRTILTSYQALQNIKEEEKAVELLEQQTEHMRQEVENATSSFELERRAREQLQRQRPNEQIIRIE